VVTWKAASRLAAGVHGNGLDQEQEIEQEIDQGLVFLAGFT